MKSVILLTAILISGIAQAYDGNSYYQYGNTTYGYNLDTGSTWNQTNTGNSYYGTDSDGNFYRGDNSTGFYQNSGTGVTCFGKGQFRYCN